jgi:hypothetical protein
MTKLQAVRWFADFVANDHVIVARGDDWNASMIDRHPRMTVPYDLMKNDEGDKLFRIDFIQRCPLARGFANVTLSILHEIGHHFNRESYLMTDSDQYDASVGYWHFMLPCEMDATDWAIEWLQDPTNRKVAKAFEREFFKAVR